MNAPKDPPASGNGQPAAAAGVQGRVIGQYIKDLSFENPNIDKLLSVANEKPNIKLEVNVAAKGMGPNIYESAIHLKAEATASIGSVYVLEIDYAGLFEFKGVPQQGLEPLLVVNCPTLLFPFVRRLAADITREGGFPPLLLDPFDFAQLYLRRQREAQSQGKPS